MLLFLTGLRSGHAAHTMFQDKIKNENPVNLAFSCLIRIENLVYSVAGDFVQRPQVITVPRILRWLRTIGRCSIDIFGF